MLSADQVPVKNPHSRMQWPEWVVLIAGSTGSALRAVRPPNLHITPVIRRGLKKIPQAGEFNDLLRRQDGGDQLTLGSGVNLIQVLLRNGLGRELAHAFVKCAL